MLVAQLVGPGKLDLLDAPTPEPGREEVLVRVAGCGVCGSDLHLYRGEDPWGTAPSGPRGLGHETAGTIAAVGPGVTRVGTGDRVAVEPGFLRACRTCAWCRRGHSELCADRGRWREGRLGVGGFAEFELVPESNVYPVAGRIPLRAAVLTDVYACAAHAVRRVGGPRPVLATVVGSGAVGLAIGQVARAAGFGPVVLVGRRKPVLDLAIAVGAADVTIDASDTEHVSAELTSVTGVTGVDVVFEAAGGAGQSIRDALTLLARGGTLCVAGAFWQDVPLPYALANRTEATVVFSSAYSQTGEAPEFATALALLATGQVRAEPLITHTFPLTRIGDAFDTALAKQSSGAVRVLVSPDESDG